MIVVDWGHVSWILMLQSVQLGFGYCLAKEMFCFSFVLTSTKFN